ncbi:MAG TPA: tetratricopeptide repeat protein, partial [Planctomycetota bacterium]|nr:tetratricopeptide repeat protein [Planctomycetota bacterium]
MRRRTTLILAVAMLAATCAWAQDAVPNPSGTETSDARTERFAARYLEVLKSRPVPGEVFRSLAMLYDATGRLDDLSARLETLRAENPGAAWPSLLLGHLESYRGEFEKARTFYDKALAVEPANYVAARELARTLEALGFQKEAETSWQRALTLVGDAARFGLDVRDETLAITRALGRIALDEGRIDDARRTWNRLVELEPTSV